LRVIDESARRTSTDACWNLQAFAEIAFHCHTRFTLSANNSIRADHGTHPAAYTPLFIPIYNSRNGILVHGSRAAYGNAWCILAVAAKHWHPLAFGHLHIKPANGLWPFGDRAIKALAGGMLHCTGHFAGFAAHAAIQTDKYFLHIASQTQFSALAIDMIYHEFRCLERIALHCKARTHNFLGTIGQKRGHILAS
jgi:hypothetical protein